MKIPDETLVIHLNVGQLRQVLLEQHYGAQQIPTTGNEGIIDTVPIEKLSELTGWSKSCIYKKCSLRKIPHHKVDKELRFDLKEVNAWIKEKKRKTGDEVVTEFEKRHKAGMKKVK